MPLTIARRISGTSLDKPSEIVRDHETRMPWAWDSLCFAVPFNMASFEGSRDIVNGIAPTTFTSVTWSRDNRGNIVAVLPLGASIEYPDNPRHDRPSTALTAYARVRRVGAGNAWGGIFGNIYAIGPPYTSWLIGDDSAALGKLNGTLADSATTLVLTADATAIGTSEYISAFLRWAAGGTVTLDILGERGNTLSSVAGSSTFGPIAYNAGKGIRINRSEDTATFNGKYSQVMVWSRRLSDVELAALVADPFGWYSSRRETVVVTSPFPLGVGRLAQVLTPQQVEGPAVSAPFAPPTSSQVFGG